LASQSKNVTSALCTSSLKFTPPVEAKRRSRSSGPREIFTPLNSKTVQLGYDSDSQVYPALPRSFGKWYRGETFFVFCFSGVYPVELLQRSTRRDSIRAYLTGELST